MFILLIKDDFLEAIEILEDSDIKWCALATMFGTQDVTKKIKLVHQILWYGDVRGGIHDQFYQYAETWFSWLWQLVTIIQL